MAIESTYNGSGVIAVNTVVMPATLLDRGGYAALQIVSLGTSGALQFQASNDGTNWAGITAIRLSSGGAPTVNMNVAGMCVSNHVGKWIRAIVSTATTAGTTTIVARVVEGQPRPAIDGDASLPVGLSAGSANVGKFWPDMSATIANGAALITHRLVSSAATTNATSVKATPGRVAHVRGHNATAALKYLKLYNKASAPTVGTDAPVYTLALAPNLPFELDLDTLGIPFSTGIAYAITGAAADADTTAVALADVVCLNIMYI